MQATVTDTGRAEVRGFPGFRATLSRFDAPSDRQTIDELGRALSEAFRADLDARPSRHVYVSTLPPELVERVDRLRRSEVLSAPIREQFPQGVITPLPETDEVYLSHYNPDLGGDHGLFARHYDGNLRSIPFGAVVRALVYLRSEGTYRVVFHTSAVDRRFRTYDVGLLDFHRELHWVEGQYDPNDGDRIVLKCNFLVTPEGRPALGKALWALNVGQFFFVKAAMEYSKSPRTLPQRAVGLGCNAARILNNVHPLLPHLVALGTPALAAVAIAWVWVG